MTIGDRGVRWYYEHLRDHDSKIKHPYLAKGDWDRKQWVEAYS